MKIDLAIEGIDNCDLKISELELISKDILHKLKIKKPQTTVIEVFLVSNEKIQQVNKQFRNIDEPTDVLSFPLESFPNSQEQTMGTIFIAPDFAKKIKVDCTTLFIHGFLHLLGYDHEANIEEWKKIEKTINKETL